MYFGEKYCKVIRLFSHTMLWMCTVTQDNSGVCLENYNIFTTVIKEGTLAADREGKVQSKTFPGGQIMIISHCHSSYWEQVMQICVSEGDQTFLMTVHLFDNKPLLEPMIYWQQGPKEEISEKFKSRYDNFDSRKGNWKYLQNVVHFVWNSISPFY